METPTAFPTPSMPGYTQPVKNNFKFSLGLIIGISVGGFAFLILVISATVLCIRRRRKRRQSPSYEWKSQFGSSKWHDLEGQEISVAGLPASDAYTHRQYHYKKRKADPLSNTITPILVFAKGTLPSNPSSKYNTTSVYGPDGTINTFEMAVTSVPRK